MAPTNHRCMGYQAMVDAPRDDVDRWAQQMRKGSTRLAILQLLSEEDRYGYDIVHRIRERTKGALSLPEGNVYPALHALEEEGTITSYWREVEPGVPSRKYYRLTPAGRRLLGRLAEAWRAHTEAIRMLLDGGT